MDLCSDAEHVVLGVATSATFASWWDVVGTQEGCGFSTTNFCTPTREILVHALCAPWFLVVSFAVHEAMDWFHELATQVSVCIPSNEGHQVVDRPRSW